MIFILNKNQFSWGQFVHGNYLSASLTLDWPAATLPLFPAHHTSSSSSPPLAPGGRESHVALLITL